MPPAQCVKATVTVAPQLFHIGVEIGVVLPPVKERHGMPMRLCCVHEMPSKKDCATENQDVHALAPVSMCMHHSLASYARVAYDARKAML